MQRRAKRCPVKVNTACVADRYAAANERIVEVTGSRLGCLVSFREMEDGTLVVGVYRADDGVIVQAGGKWLQGGAV